jgi:hypothetical protein
MKSAGEMDSLMRAVQKIRKADEELDVWEQEKCEIRARQRAWGEVESGNNPSVANAAETAVDKESHQSQSQCIPKNAGIMSMVGINRSPTASTAAAQRP